MHIVSGSWNKSLYMWTRLESSVIVLLRRFILQQTRHLEILMPINNDWQYCRQIIINKNQQLSLFSGACSDIFFRWRNQLNPYATKYNQIHCVDELVPSESCKPDGSGLPIDEQLQIRGPTRFRERPFLFGIWTPPLLYLFEGLCRVRIMPLFGQQL